jgi:hypothetical protein
VLLYWREDCGLQDWFIKESLLSKADLSKLLRAVEATPAVEKFHWLVPADLEWQTSLDNTKLTVGLSHLQRLGFVRQHPNICHEVKVTARENSELATAIMNAGKTIDTREFCRTHQVSPVEWMAQLYDAQWRGELHFYGVEDCWLVECLRPSSELAAITEIQLGMHDLERQKQRRLEQMLLYAITPECRELIIRRYFGELVTKNDRCGRCDNCNPTRKATLDAVITQQIAVDEFLQRRETPELTGPDLDGGVALAFHTFMQNGERFHTEVGKRVEAFKYHGGKNQLEWLLERALQTLFRYPYSQEVDTVAFVPSTDTTRQYLPVPLFADYLRQRLGVHAVCQLRKTRVTRPQKEMVTMEQKRRNVAGAFAVQEPGVKGQCILLIDDIYDSGATINECARVLKAAGATKVYALTLTKTRHVAK